MAISRVTIHHANINAHFQRAPLSGTQRGSARGLARGDARAIADRMALQARLNADARFAQRTGALVSSVVPIVRTGRGGDVEVGVGTRVEQGKWLEIGTRAHIIRPQKPFRGRGRGGYLLRSNGPKSKGFNPDPLERPQMMVQAPALTPRLWMSDAVRSVIPGARVRVRVFK